MSTIRRLPSSSAGPLLMVVATAVLARLPILWALDTVTTGWHSADYGSIARNYYENGFRFLYPQVDWGGDGPGFVEMEFPLVPFLTALIYGLVGAADDRWAVVVPFVSGVLAACYTYWLGRLLFGVPAAVVGAMLVAVSPVLLRFTQLAFPEGPLLAASAAAMFYVVRWHRSGARRDLLIGGACASLAVLFKPTALVLGVPFAWLFWLRDGRQVLRDPMFYVFGLVVLVPPVLWYGHALSIAVTYGNSFGVLFGGGSSKLWRGDLLVLPEFYMKLAGRLVVYHFTLGGAAAILWALLRERFTPEGRTVVIWAAATLASFLVITMGNHETAYYQLPVVVPGCLLAGLGLVRFNRDLVAFVGARHRRMVSVALAGAVTAGVVIGTSEHYSRSDYVPFTRPAAAAARELSGHLRPGARIVFSEPQSTTEPLPRGRHVTPPVPFYFSGHKGWYLAPEWVTADEVRALAVRGAEYFVVSDLAAFQLAQPGVTDWLQRSYHRVRGPAWATWDLTLSLP